MSIINNTVIKYSFRKELIKKLNILINKPSTLLIFNFIDRLNL